MTQQSELKVQIQTVVPSLCNFDFHDYCNSDDIFIYAAIPGKGYFHLKTYLDHFYLDFQMKTEGIKLLEARSNSEPLIPVVLTTYLQRSPLVIF